MPIQDYADWRRPDGRPFDPWLRTHLRLGGQIIGTSAASQVFTGTLDQWQSWSGQALPVSGEYIVPQAISPLIVDLTVDLGTLTEPCIWVRHR